MGQTSEVTEDLGGRDVRFEWVRQVAATAAHQIDQVPDLGRQLVGDEHAFDRCSQVLHVFALVELDFVISKLGSRQAFFENKSAIFVCLQTPTND